MRPRRTLFLVTLTASVVLEIAVRRLDLWPLLGGEMDSVIHFLWSFNGVLAFAVILRWQPLAGLLGVFVAHAIWEALEILGDLTIPQRQAMIDHFFFDGMVDTLVGLAGALLGCLVLLRLPGGAEDLRPARAQAGMLAYLCLLPPMLVIGSVGTAMRGSSMDLFALVWLVASAPVAWLLVHLWRWRFE